jgi:hypothetical protein
LIEVPGQQTLELTLIRGLLFGLQGLTVGLLLLLRLCRGFGRAPEGERQSVPALAPFTG